MENLPGILKHAEIISVDILRAADSIHCNIKSKLAKQKS